MNAFSGLVAFKPKRHLFAQHLFVLAGVVILALTTAGCFDNEPQQRRAFITFLQTRIIDKPGLHIPIMSDKDVADFGPMPTTIAS